MSCFNLCGIAQIKNCIKSYEKWYMNINQRIKIELQSRIINTLINNKYTNEKELCQQKKLLS